MSPSPQKKPGTPLSRVEAFACDRVHPARVIEVAVDQAVEEMADVKPAAPSGGVRVTYAVDRVAVGPEHSRKRYGNATPRSSGERRGESSGTPAGRKLPDRVDTVSKN